MRSSSRPIGVHRGLVVAALALAGCLGSAPAGNSDLGWDPNSGLPYHPAGYAAADVHGTELKQQTQDCRTCHGDDLTGGISGVSCDTCHDTANPTAWRSQCTFCHGGTNDQTGAPPRDIDGATTNLTFPPHTKHVSTTTITNPFDCIQCHVKANDVLSPGHVFDGTPGVAETDFGTSLSRQGVYANGTCANLYCHGNGQQSNGMVATSDGPRTCTSCHAGVASGATGWATMTGPHSKHLGSTLGGAMGCQDCHSGTTPDGASISTSGKAMHVNGTADVTIPTTNAVIWNASTQSCTGTCHTYVHTGKIWQAAGQNFHPPGYSTPLVHGADEELQRMDCRSCHGATLMGNTTTGAANCDSCHKAGWRTNCTYCHGGGANQTGAPPRDIASAPNTASQSFVAHTAHVAATRVTPYDCTQCHVKPTDVLSTNHNFDSTPAKAEVTFAAGLDPGGTYDGKDTCTTYCHGNGQTATTRGTYVDGNASPGCGTCHGAPPGTGDHGRHRSYTCEECHSGTAKGSTAIKTPALHVNKAKDTAFLAGGFTFDANTKKCTGSCHGKNHNGFTW